MREDQDDQSMINQEKVKEMNSSLQDEYSHHLEQRQAIKAGEALSQGTVEATQRANA